MTDTELAALAKAATPGPWKVDWYEAHADNDAEAKAAKCKVGDALWRVARSIGPVSPDHNHWAGHYVADEADAKFIAAWTPERALAALAVIEAVREHVDCDPDYSFGDLKQALVAWDALAMTKGSA